jgi:hypothetical protein
MRVVGAIAPPGRTRKKQGALLAPYLGEAVRL